MLPDTPQLDWIWNVLSPRNARNLSGSDRRDYAYLLSAMETFLYFPAQTGISVLVLMLLTEDRDTALAIPYIASIV